jgi:stage V sporulation protein R
MEYDKLSKRDAYGLGRIYEMVINNDPCYAYLQESNNVTDQKLVMAHVYGHADFFKHNFWFSKTNRKMMDQMANHATRVRRHIERQGQESVERFLDACLSIEHLIDPHSMFVPRATKPRGPRGPREDDRPDPFEPSQAPRQGLHGPVHQPAARRWTARSASTRRSSEGRKAQVPRAPTRDVLLFLLRHAGSRTGSRTSWASSATRRTTSRRRA